MRPEDEIVEAELMPDELMPDELPADDRTKSGEPETTRKALIEQVLSPYAMQWMMICGGGVLILGFVIWLWSVGIFENPIVVASLVGAATIGTLAAGVAMVRLTRYQLAGRGVAMLGSIALPLNLWLYDAQGLVTLADGGHLWIPAALCCLIYAGVARVLKDSTFVYALVGGVVMTGMLFLADETVGRFWTLTPPVTFLVVIGWISTFAERLFNDDDGDFSRKNFGLAFQRSGLLVVTSGLALLFGNHVILWINWCLGDPVWSLVSSQPQKIWALGIIASSMIGFGLQAVAKQSRVYQVATITLLGWLVFVVLDVLSITISVSHLAIAVAVLTIVGNVVLAMLQAGKAGAKLTTLGQAITKTVDDYSLVATCVISLLALGQFFVQFQHPTGTVFFGPLGWVAVFQILSAGLAACAFGVRTLITSQGKDSETTRLMIGAGPALITAGLLTAIDIQSLVSVQVAMGLALVLPALVAAATIFAKKPIVKDALQLMAGVFMTAHLAIRGLVDLNAAVDEFHVFDLPALQWSAVLFVSATVYWMISAGKARSASRTMSYLCSTFAVALAGHHFGFAFGFCLVLAPMIVGTAMRVYEALAQVGKLSSADVNDGSLSLTANSLVLGSGVGGVLMALSHWLSSDATGALMLVMIVQLACLTLTSLLTTNQAWRTGFRALIVATVGACICVFDGWLDMHGWQRLELCSLLGGSILLVLGHMTWMREDGQTDDVASASLLTGSLLVAAPLAVGLLVYRLGLASDPNWMQFHEMTAIVAALTLFGTGVLARLRATTISGAGLLGVYLLSLLTLIRLPDQLQNVSVMMMVGGGVLFVAALLMSIYRDRLMSLPKRIREGKGVYQILKWR